METVAARSGFVSYDETTGPRLESMDEPVDVAGSAANSPHIGDLGAAIVRDVGHREGIFVNIETNEQRSGFFHG